MEPLAQRLRPRTLDEVCGQQHLLGKNQVFRRTVESGKIPNMIFYGPSGVGKTTVASIIAAGSGSRTSAHSARRAAFFYILTRYNILTSASNRAFWNVWSRVPSP